MRLAVIAALAGCGRVGFAPRTGDLDAGDATPPMIDAPPCTFGPWSVPVRVPELSSTFGDYGGQITRDGLSYYFHSDRTGGGDFYYAHRPDRTSMFSGPMLLATISTTAYDFDIAPTLDELEVYFSSDRTSEHCLYHASRTTTGGAFGAATRLDAFCTAMPAAGAFITDDNLGMYYTLENGSFEGTIMRSTRSSTAVAFAPGTAVPELLDGIDKGYPVLSSDGRELFYDFGSVHHLVTRTRADTASPFGPAVMMTVNSPSDIDEDVSITGDGTELFFASGRPGGAGGDDIYRATRSCL